jgi:Flp pilus assembly protein TadD
LRDRGGDLVGHAATSNARLRHSRSAVYWSEQYDRAIPLFINYLEQRPDDALANARLGVSYCNVSRFQDAIPLLHKASALDKTDYQSRNNLALAYDALQQQ